MPVKAPPSDLALLRYQIISAYLALEPPRGQRTEVLQTLAAKRWSLADGEPVQFAAETLRGWVRKFRLGGLAALENAPRIRPGVQVLDETQKNLICTLKKDVPARSIDRVIEIAEEMSLVTPGVLKRSTVHRVLASRGLSGRKRGPANTEDLDRFEAAFPNDLWQSDMLKGPWLPDPERPGKMRQAWLHAFLDDHSRLLLAGRWGFKSDLPTLELVFREALRRHGLPKRVYYDNGGPYRSHHMRQIVSVLSNQRPIYTPARRPEGHGKIEAFNRLCRAAFVEEVKASSITDLDGLNRAFSAWRDLKYNRRPHEETGQAPWDRWRAGADRIEHAGERFLVEAFLFRANRTTDKTGVLRLFGTKYQVGHELARKKVGVRYDPERMETIEVWHGDTFQERVKPLAPLPNRRPVQKTETEPPATAAVVDYLAHLVDQHQPVPVEDVVEVALRERKQLDEAVYDVLSTRVSPETFEEKEVREFLARYGPLEPGPVQQVVDLAIEMGGADQHIHVFLAGIRDAIGGDA